MHDEQRAVRAHEAVRLPLIGGAMWREFTAP